MDDPTHDTTDDTTNDVPPTPAADADHSGVSPAPSAQTPSGRFPEETPALAIFFCGANRI
ncbi:hypothetical protein [Streptomyces mexicanus]|uniref:hypothetical protein n=1 Tax=Streptomyces mexicanus TaxID=178566 RepID=UPI0036A656F9